MTAPDDAPHAPAWLSRWPLHAPLVPVFLVLSFYSQNIQTFEFGVTLRPLLVGATAALLLCAAFAALLRDLRKAGLVSALACALFMTSGRALAGFEGDALLLGVHPATALRLLGGALVTGLAILLARVRWTCELPTALLNLLLLSTTGVACLQIATYQLEVRPAPLTSEADAPLVRVADPAALPHIVHIVLDGYGRHDVLREWYGHDNEPFLRALEQRGFYVAREANANYCQTGLSLPSTLGMRPFDGMPADSGDRQAMVTAFQQNAVCRTLRSLGYTVMVYPSGYHVTAHIEGASYAARERLSQFERGLLDLSALATGSAGSLPAIGEASADAHRARLRFAFEHIPTQVERRKPTFVIAHLICPHPPFLLDAEGRPLPLERRYDTGDGNDWLAWNPGKTPDDYRAGYIAQLRYANAAVLRTIDQIQARAARPTVILLQSDHGPGSMLDWVGGLEQSNPVERLAILSATRYPDRDYKQLHPRISPVNTYRLLFNRTFQLSQPLPLLPDRSYFSTLDRPYHFHDVTDRLRAWAEDRR